MSRLLKKITHKYEFLKLELQEVEEELDKYLQEWNTTFGKYFADKNAEVWVNEETGEIRKEKPGEESDTKKPKKIIPEKLKKLYKKLSTRTHPDKGGTAEEFNAIKESYHNEDLLELLKYAGIYEIDFILEEEDQELIEKTISKFETEIEVQKNSMAYTYFTGNRNRKLGVIKMLEAHLGIKIKKEDYPKELLDLI